MLDAVTRDLFRVEAIVFLFAIWDTQQNLLYERTVVCFQGVDGIPVYFAFTSRSPSTQLSKNSKTVEGGQLLVLFHWTLRKFVLLYTSNAV